MLGILPDEIAAPDSHVGFDPVGQLDGLKMKPCIARRVVQEKVDGLVCWQGRVRGDVDDERPDLRQHNLGAKMESMRHFAHGTRAEEGGLGCEAGDGHRYPGLLH